MIKRFSHLTLNYSQSLRGDTGVELDGDDNKVRLATVKKVIEIMSPEYPTITRLPSSRKDGIRERRSCERIQDYRG